VRVSNDESASSGRVGEVGLTVRFRSDVAQPLVVVEGGAIEHVCGAGDDHHLVWQRGDETLPFLEAFLDNGRIDVFPSRTDTWRYWCGDHELRPVDRHRTASGYLTDPLSRPWSDGSWISRSRATGIAMRLVGPQQRFGLHVDGSLQEFALWDSMCWLEYYGFGEHRPLLEVSRDEAFLSLPGSKGSSLTFHEKQSKVGLGWSSTTEDVKVEHERVGNFGASEVRVTHLPSGVSVTVGDQPTTVANRERARALLAEELGEDDA
jgi:hypothetical protein